MIAAVKYRNIGTEPLKKRLSRLNMHSVKKKSNRLKYRLSAHIGLVRVEKDPVFDHLAEDLDRCERRICKLLHAIQIYRQTIVLQSKKYVDTYTSNEKLSTNSDVINAEVRSYCKHLLNSSSSLAQYLDDTLCAEAKKFLRLPITKVIQKRYDKLIDYVSAKNEDKNPDEIRLRQCDYEALNNQLKAALPKTIESIKKRTLTSVEIIFLKDMEFFDSLSKLREGLSEEACRCLAVPFSTFVGSRDIRLHSFISINRAINAGKTNCMMKSLQRVNNSFKKQSVKEQSFLGIQNTPLVTRQSCPPPRPTLPKKIIEKMRECESSGKDLIDLDDNLLDLVTPLPPNYTSSTQPPNDANQNNKLLCDKSNVALQKSSSNFNNLLDTTFVAEMPLSTTADALLNDLFPTEKEKNQVLSALDAPLIPFRPYDQISDQQGLSNICYKSSSKPLQIQSSLESPNAHSTVIQDAENKPSLPATEVILRENKIPYYDVPVDNYGLPNGFECSRKVSSGDIFSSAKNGIAPVRSAPPPPSSTICFNKLAKPKDVLRYENCQYQAEFDFTGSADCHISLSAGEKVCVLKNYDDANNEEWWLVRKECGGVGYVPASYLRVI
uniref:SH3 domain-containing protein n=1 Tax=Syphacia muris TaxID=451379 RepID=A0A0N5AUV9_9BILA